MKQVGIIALVVILIVFGTPLLSVRDNYKNMEYEEIGLVMLDNVETYVDVLDTTSSAVQSTIDFLKEALTNIVDFTSSIADFIKEIFEFETNQTCSGNYNDGWYCGSSEGGGGGSIVGGHR